MAYLRNWIWHLPGYRWVQIALFASALILWPVLRDRDVLDRFYAATQLHDAWQLDQIALLVTNLFVAILLALVVQARHTNTVIRQREAERERATAAARHDPLTGLMNRRAFTELLTRIHKDGQGPGRIIACVDLDRFKYINDLHGHQGGDAVLLAVAGRLTETIEGLGIAARIGGDEFAILFDAEINTIVAERVVRQVQKSIVKQVPFGPIPLMVGSSVGLAQWQTFEGPGEATLHADKALDFAKDGQRGSFAWYAKTLDTASTERALIETELRSAISNNALVPYFQPIFSISTGQACGMEVLARWHHPQRGFIPPDHFVPIAEECGMVDDLGWLILRAACSRAANWSHDLFLSFNVSPQQFRDDGFVERIMSILEETGFNAQRLKVEVTESAVIRDFAFARKILYRLIDLGIDVALDDFGTGYSSLASMRDLPFDRIKIDRSFVTGMKTSAENEKIVRGILALAQGLDLAVTAEGVENAYELRELASLGCELGQGFFFDRAVPAEDVPIKVAGEWATRAAEIRALLDADAEPSRASA